jgi:hypothetical protein
LLNNDFIGFSLHWRTGKGWEKLIDTRRRREKQ